KLRAAIQSWAVLALAGLMLSPGCAGRHLASGSLPLPIVAAPVGPQVGGGNSVAPAAWHPPLLAAVESLMPSRPGEEFSLTPPARPSADVAQPVRQPILPTPRLDGLIAPASFELDPLTP